MRVCALVLGFFLVISRAEACTGLLLTAQDGGAINGRTVEFATQIEMSVAVVPRGFAFVGNGGKGMPYTAKYAAAGIYCFDNQVLMDGVNEKGLTAAAFYFPGFASYGTVTDPKQALSPVEFPNWILSQFATIEEVKGALESVVIAPTVVPNWGPTPPPMHYIVYDKSGKSLVIEPLGGKLVTYDNPIGTFTNSPTFDWHLTNLRNYINLSPFNAPPITLRGLTLAPFGEGSGQVGLPGDFTPPSRFVRAALFSTTALPSKTSNEAVYQTFHLLNQFDIPYGTVRQKGNGHIDYTQLTSVKDPQSLKYYYRSYNDQTISFVDLNQSDLDAKTILSKKVGGNQTSVDVSSTLKGTL